MSRGIGLRSNGYAIDMASDQPEKVGIEEARREIAGGEAIAVDVRSDQEWSEGHVPGATHLPDGEAGDRADRPVEGARLMVIAKNGRMAIRAASRLSEQGYEAVAVDGDMSDWISEDYNLQPTPDPDEDTELGLK
jgi:rhodanese-related sulfurtransferase